MTMTTARLTYAVVRAQTLLGILELEPYNLVSPMQAKGFRITLQHEDGSQTEAFVEDDASQTDAGRSATPR